MVGHEFWLRNVLELAGLRIVTVEVVDEFWIDDVTDLAVCVDGQRDVSSISDCKVDSAILLSRPIFHGG